MSNKPQVPHTMDDFSMGRPVAGFSQTRTGMWIGVSLLLHIVLITGTSLGFIRDTWIDPEAAKERKAKAAEAAKAAATQPTAATKPASGAAGAPAAANGKAGSSGASSTGDSNLDAAKDTPVVKRSTEAAKASEIPSKPDDLGISLDDTNGGGKKK